MQGRLTVILLKIQKKLIVETTKTGDQEEESETYKGTVDSVEADVIYLPFQEGIYLYLEDSKREAIASSINKNYADVSLETKDGIYSLSCREKK